MAKDTKQRFLSAALTLFAENGYAGTNIRQLSAALELGKSSLYRHFESKEQVWNAVLQGMSEYYEQQIALARASATPPKTADQLAEMTLRMVRFTVNDEKVVLMRKILQTEQFRDGTVRDLATRYFMQDIKAYFQQLFTELIADGILKQADPAFLAVSYTAPITLLIHLCDRDPKAKPAALGEIEGYIRAFIDQYKA